MKDAEGPEVVANTIYIAANDVSSKMRYAGGKQGPMLLLMRNFFSDKLYFWMVRKNYNVKIFFSTWFV